MIKTHEPIVCLVGRTNVGKSTLFNKILSKRISIVHDSLNVTRDPVVAKASWNGCSFNLVDCGGLELISSDSVMNQKITKSALREIKNGDIVVFVLNIHDGVLPIDSLISVELKKTHKPVILCVNKCDDINSFKDINEFYSLGTPIGVSSIHGIGTGDLLDAIIKESKILGFFRQKNENKILEIIKETENKLEEDEDVLDRSSSNSGFLKSPIRITVIGRPNAGKSSFINKICDTDHFIVDDIAGTTRDSTNIEIIKNKRKYIFVDTAGICKNLRSAGQIQWYSIFRSKMQIDDADICVCIVDATDNITRQDVKIAAMAKDAGKPCILLINKWDLIEERERNILNFQKKIENDFNFMSYTKPLFISVKTGQRIHKIFELTDLAFKNSSFRITTGILNDLLNQFVKRVTPPNINNCQLKIYYMSQVAINPPTFLFFVNKKRLFHFSYQRYLENCLRQVFDFSYTPIRFLIREKNEISNH